MQTMHCSGKVLLKKQIIYQQAGQRERAWQEGKGGISDITLLPPTTMP